MGDLVPGNGIQRQNTVNMLDPLPDLDFFSYPVDDFFDSYVTELGARGLSALSWLSPAAAHLLRRLSDQLMKQLIGSLCLSLSLSPRPRPYC